MMNVRLYFVDDEHIITFQLGIKYCKYCNMSGRYAIYDELWTSDPNHHTHELYLGKLLRIRGKIFEFILYGTREYWNLCPEIPV